MLLFDLAQEFVVTRLSSHLRELEEDKNVEHRPNVEARTGLAQSAYPPKFLSEILRSKCCDYDDKEITFVTPRRLQYEVCTVMRLLGGRSKRGLLWKTMWSAES